MKKITDSLLSSLLSIDTIKTIILLYHYNIINVGYHESLPLIEPIFVIFK